MLVFILLWINRKNLKNQRRWWFNQRFHRSLWLLIVDGLTDVIDGLSGVEIDVNDPELKIVPRPLISWGLLWPGQTLCLMVTSYDLSLATCHLPRERFVLLERLLCEVDQNRFLQNLHAVDVLFVMYIQVFCQLCNLWVVILVPNEHIDRCVSAR